MIWKELVSGYCTCTALPDSKLCTPLVSNWMGKESWVVVYRVWDVIKVSKGDWVWETKSLSISQSGNPNTSRSWKTQESKRKVCEREARKLTMEADCAPGDYQFWGPSAQVGVRREPKPECSQVLSCWAVIDVLSWRELFLPLYPNLCLLWPFQTTGNIRSSH